MEKERRNEIAFLMLKEIIKNKDIGIQQLKKEARAFVEKNKDVSGDEILEFYKEIIIEQLYEAKEIQAGFLSL